MAFSDPRSRQRADPSNGSSPGDEYAYVIVETCVSSTPDTDADNSEQMRQRWTELNEWGAMGYALVHSFTAATGPRTTIFDTMQLHVHLD